MNYFCVIIVLNCLIDASFSIQITVPSGNITFLESPEQVLNQTDTTDHLNWTSVPFPDANVSRNLSSSENSTEIYTPNFRREAFSALSGWENITRSEGTISVDAHYNGFGFTELAGIVSVCFLVFAIFGYFGFIFLRKYLLNRYGNSQTLITEDEYDTSDLRNFTI